MAPLIRFQRTALYTSATELNYWDASLQVPTIDSRGTKYFGRSPPLFMTAICVELDVSPEVLQVFISRLGPQGKLLDLTGRGMDAERDWVQQRWRK